MLFTWPNEEDIFTSYCFFFFFTNVLTHRQVFVSRNPPMRVLSHGLSSVQCNLTNQSWQSAGGRATEADAEESRHTHVSKRVYSDIYLYCSQGLRSPRTWTGSLRLHQITGKFQSVFHGRFGSGHQVPPSSCPLLQISICVIARKKTLDALSGIVQASSRMWRIPPARVSQVQRWNNKQPVSRYLSA